ncbi:MAG: GNAT family N-acetyltransferase [Thermoanaerobaculia bacterium]
MISSGPREIGEADFRLREVTPADSQNLYCWRMDPSSRPMFRSTEKVPFEAHASLLARYFSPDNRDRWFVIEADGAPVGAITVHEPPAGSTEAEWGRLVVAPEARGRGYGKRALTLLIEYARRTGLSRLRCEVLVGNAAAETIYRELGFHETGREESEGRVFRYLAMEL